VCGQVIDVKRGNRVSSNVDKEDEDNGGGRLRISTDSVKTIIPSSLPMDIPPRMLFQSDFESDDGESKPHELAARTYQETENYFDGSLQNQTRKIHSLI